MTQLQKLFEEVREEVLTKTQLENYHTQLTNLFAQMLLESATLEKAEAIYFLENKKTLNGDKGFKDRSDVEIKRMWRGTPEGQRLIDLKASAKATEKVLSSLKNRIYASL